MARAVAADQVPERLARHAGAAVGQKQRIALPASAFHIPRDPFRRLLAERHQALLRALAHRAHHASVEVHFEGLQRHQLGHAQPGGVEQLEHRAVAQAHGRGRVRRGEQRFDVRLRQRFREARRALGRIELERRIDLDAPLAQAVLVEALQRRHAPRRARGATLARAEEGEQIGFCLLSSVVSFETRELLRSARYEAMVFFDSPSSSQSASQNASRIPSSTARARTRAPRASAANAWPPAGSRRSHARSRRCRRRRPRDGRDLIGSLLSPQHWPMARASAPSSFASSP